MKISELLTPELIKLNLSSVEKDELLEEMVQVFVGNGLITDREAAVRILEAREAMMSTGVGNGIAIPHGKLTEAKRPMLALGISGKGIDFDALDGEPVYIVLTIFVHPDDPVGHLELLAEISRLFGIPGIGDRIREATTPQKVLEIIKSEE